MTAASHGNEAQTSAGWHGDVRQTERAARHLFAVLEGCDVRQRHRPASFLARAERVDLAQLRVRWGLQRNG